MKNYGIIEGRIKFKIMGQNGGIWSWILRWTIDWIVNNIKKSRGHFPEKVKRHEEMDLTAVWTHGEEEGEVRIASYCKISWMLHNKLGF